MKKFYKIFLLSIIGLFSAGIISAALGDWWDTTKNIVPRTTQLVDIGSSTKLVKTGYFGNITFTTSTINGISYSWPATAGVVNYVLSTNGSGILSWAVQSGGGGSSSGFWTTTTNNLAIHPVDTNDVVIIGGLATTSNETNILEVIGNVQFNNNFNVDGLSHFNGNAFFDSSNITIDSSNLRVLTGNIYTDGGNLYATSGNAYLGSSGGNVYLGNVLQGNWYGKAIKKDFLAEGYLNQAYATTTYLTKTGNLVGTFQGHHSNDFLTTSYATTTYLAKTGNLLGTLNGYFQNSLTNQAYASSTYVWASNWTTIDNYPSGCGAGQYVSAIGDTLTCSTPAGTGGSGTSNWTRTSGLLHPATSTDGVLVGGSSTTTSGYKFEVIGSSLFDGIVASASSTIAGDLTIGGNLYGGGGGSYVPYTGATTNLDLGNNDLILGGTFQIDDGGSILFRSAVPSDSLYLTSENIGVLSVSNPNNIANLNFVSLTTNRQFLFPDLDGTFLMATGTQNILTTGSATTTNLTLTGIKNCDTIDTDANGNLKCGTDADTDYTFKQPLVNGAGVISLNIGLGLSLSSTSSLFVANNAITDAMVVDTITAAKTGNWLGTLGGYFQNSFLHTTYASSTYLAKTGNHLGTFNGYFQNSFVNGAYATSTFLQRSSYFASTTVSYIERCATFASTTFNNYDNVPMWNPYQGITVIEERCYSTGGTSVVLTISDGTNNLDTITCATSLTKDSSLSNNTWSTDELMEIDFGTNTGASDYVNICIIYKKDLP